MRYLLLLLLYPSMLDGQTPSVFDHMREGSSVATYLHGCQTKQLSPEGYQALTASLHHVQLEPSLENQVQIGNYTLNFTSAPSIKLYKSKDSSSSLYIETFQSKPDLDSKWASVPQWRGRYSGYESLRSAYYYLKLDTLFNTSLNATLKTSNTIINIQKKLPFRAADVKSISPSQLELIIAANTNLLEILHVLSDHLVTEKEKINFPSNGKLFQRRFSAAERLTGFIHFWTEVKYNFAFFSHVPQLDWDDLLVEYLPKIEADQSNTDYYDLLTAICAKLNDGHTNIYPPSDLMATKYSPNVELGSINDKVYVLNTSEKFRNLIPIGSAITKVNAENIAGYFQQHLFPYISASTPYIKQNIAARTLLDIPAGKTLKIDFIAPNGVAGSYEFSSEKDTSDWIIEDPEWHKIEFKKLKHNTAYLKINTFQAPEVVDKFLTFKDSIKACKKLIIDLRENGGGNSGYGYEILKYFSPKPFLTSKWMTREHKAAYKAWGESVDAPPTDEWEEKCLLTYQGNYWYVADPDTIVPYLDQYIPIPIVILIGNNTASAAEDFLIAADNIGLTETVGDLTFGSTGQPLAINLPGGGSARICTKKDTYPDGREFVGYGIKPKYTLKPGIKEVLEKKDVVLEFALEHKF